ncbi:unnamed protein product [Rhizopus stolonifer]
MPTYYEVLGVSETASTELIKQKFHQLILEHHPDKFQEMTITVQLNKSKKQTRPCHGAEVDLDDMEYNEEEKSFSLECRCSGTYEITENDLENDIDIVGCNNCSLKIRVLYEVLEDE